MTSLLVSTGDSSGASEWNSDSCPEPAGSLADLELAVPGGDGSTTDLLGVPVGGLQKRPPVPTRLCFHMELRARDCPLGPLATAYSVTGDGRIRRNSVTSRVAPMGFSFDNSDGQLIVIEAPYRDLLLWLHRDVILGNLLVAGADIHCDLIDIAALDGIVSAPPADTPEGPVVERLIELAPQHQNPG